MSASVRKTVVTAVASAFILAAGAAFSIQAYAEDVADATTTVTIDGSSVTSAVPLKYEDGKYVFDESAFEGMTDEQIESLLKEIDMPPGKWETAAVQKTKKGYALQDGKIVSVDIPYTVEVRTNYVFYDSHIVYKGLVQGSTAPTTDTFKYDTPTFDLEPATSTSKWLFEGWYTGENGTGLRVEQVKQFTKSDVIVYANYVPNFYIVRFSANGGDGLIDDVEVNRNADFILPTSSMRKTGYNFVGWNTNPDRSGDMISDQAKINDLTVFNDIALYAQYDPITYMVSFNANGGTGTMQTQSILYGTSKALSASTMKKEGLKFAGWNTKANGSGEWYGDESIVHNLVTSEKEVVTLYAQYEDPAAPNPFESMTGTVFVGDTVFGDFNPVTTSYNMDGMPQQVSISGAPVNFAVESVETSEISEVQGANTVEKSQQTSIKVRYYGATETKERVYKFNWTWTEGMGSSFGKEITTVPVFKHGDKYSAGSYTVGTDIKAGSYLIEHEPSAESVLLKKNGSDKPYAMKDAHSYDLATGDIITAEVPFYLIEEFDTSTMSSSAMTVGAIQMVNEATSRGDGLYAEVDPIKGVVSTSPIEGSSDGLTDSGTLVNTETPRQEVTNNVIEEVKQEEIPDYIKNEMDARTNTTYEVVEPGDGEKTDKTDNDNKTDSNNTEISAYYGTWKFESFTEDTQKMLAEWTRGDKVEPQYKDGTYNYSDNYTDEIRTVYDFVEADNKIEISDTGLAIQTFKYKDSSIEYKSYAKWEPIENQGKLEGIRITAYESDYSVTAIIMSGKLVLDRTSMYASIFAKVEDSSSSGSSMTASSDEPGKTSGGGGGGTSMSTQSSSDQTYGFVSPYSVFGFLFSISQHLGPQDTTNPATNYQDSGGTTENTSKNENQPAKNETKEQPAKNENQPAKNEVKEQPAKTENQPAKNETKEQPAKNESQPAKNETKEQPAKNENQSVKTEESPSKTDPQPSNPPSGLTGQELSTQSGTGSSTQSGAEQAPSGQSETTIEYADGTVVVSHTNTNGTVTYVETTKDGTETTWVVDANIVPEAQPTQDDITTKFEQIAQEVAGLSPETIKIISETLKRNLANIGQNVSNGIADVAIVNAIEFAKQTGIISDTQSDELKSTAKDANDDLFKETEKRAIREFVDTLPEGGTDEDEVVTVNNSNRTVVPLNTFNRNERIENTYQNYNAANAPDPEPRNNNNVANKEPQMKNDSSGILDEDGIIAQMASNDVLRAGIVGLPVLIIVLIAAFMFARNDEN